MARIPQKFIDDLLDRIDIVDVVDRRVKLRKTGKNFSACCPFHDEKTPSFSVNPEKQFYYCFGCGAGGNALGFIMDYERMDFPEAVESLAHTVGLEVPKEETKPGEKPQQDSNRPLFDQLEQAARFYEHALRKHPDAKRAVTYLKKRGLTGEIAKAFRIGFAPPGWDNLMKAAGQNEPQQALLMTGGMLVKNDKGRTYDRFRDRIMFPILDARGRVIAFGGRVLGDEKPKYLNSPETPVFHKSRELYGLYQARKVNRSLTRIVVVEGYMDVIALAQHGITYAVATLGTATSESHIERLFRHVSEVVFCFDGDEAGRKAAFRALESALPTLQDGRQARFLFLPDGEDPDSLVRAKGQGHLEHLFDTAAPLEKFLFDHLAEGLDLEALDGRARFSKLAAPFLHRLPEGVFRTLMYQALAERTGIDVDSLKRLQAPPPQPAAQTTTSNRSDSGSDRAIAPHNLSPATGPDLPYAPPAGPEDYGHSPSYGAQEMPPMDSGYHPEDLRADYPDAAYTDNITPEFDSSPGEAHLASGNGPAFDDSLTPSSTNPVHRLLGLLVLNPQLAMGVDADQLPRSDRKDCQLLLEFIENVKVQPDLSTAALLGFWFGTPEGQLLTDLAGREPLEDADGQAALFNALVEKMIREQALSELRSRHNELKTADYAQLTPDEKHELLTLTRKIREVAGKD